MGTPTRVALFVTALVAAFGVAWGGGRLIGPLGTPAPAHASESRVDAEAGPDDDSASASSRPGGLQVSESGYTLVLAATGLQPGRSPLRFTVTGPDGEAVVAYDEEHERDLHLIAVRRDLTGYQHVHPTMAADGTWTTELDLTPGSWRVLTDFAPTGGPALTLGTDLDVAGRYAPAEHPGHRASDTVDGYTVDLGGDLDEGAVTLRVSRDGEPVPDLEPHLGASGHLVALREGDLAFVHVHPQEQDTASEVPFAVEVPSPGGYRLFFDFRHDGVVRTASFAVRSTAGDPQREDDSHGH